MSPGSSERQVYRSFWNKYSGRADNTSMLLNANADELAELDKAEIIGLLPNFEGKFVVDIGAGIGRFTSEFAKSASKVVSTDFMESFIEKNRERTGHFGNIEYRVGDALGLQFDAASVDLVFTNWLLMYLSDAETVHFLANVLKWMKPGGHLHLRESCSEPSSGGEGDGGATSSSLHSQTEVNPTRYRFSSAYIHLLRAIRFRDDNGGKLWRFHVHWACSVGVYVEKNGNWRQVHWLLSKVAATGEKIPSKIELSGKLAGEWPNEQQKWDEQLEGAMAANKMLTEKLAMALDGGGIGPDSTLLTFNTRQCPTHIGIHPHTLANHFGCRLWSVETSAFCYRHTLTVANREKDRRVRISWHCGLESALAFCKGAHFGAFLAVDLFANIRGPEDVENIGALLQMDGQLMSLEGRKVDSQKIDLFLSHFTIEAIHAIHMGDGAEMELVVARKKPKECAPWTAQKPPIIGGF